MTMNYPIIPDLDTQAAILYGIDKYLREVIGDEEIFMSWLSLGCPDDCCSINDVRSCLDPDGETFREWIELANRLLEEDSDKNRGAAKPICEARGCGYWYQDEDESYPSCHCPDDGFPAPCEEEEDDEPDDIDDDCGFDPYEGSFTYDC